MKTQIEFDKLSFRELTRLYPEGVKILEDKIRNYTKEELNFRPDIQDAWTISEHIRHLADSEDNFYIRAKLAIAEPGKTIVVLEEDIWQKMLYTEEENLSDYMEMFAAIRKVLSPILNRITGEKAEEFFINHPVRGRMTLKELVKIYVRHVYFHLDYLDRNIEEYRKDSKKQSNS